VIWEDFAIQGGWHRGASVEESRKKPFLVQTVGFMLSASPGRIVMAAGFAQTEQEGYQELMTIPRGMIKAMIPLGVCKNVKKSTKKSSHSR
jgi:hypothetical protein